MWVSVWDEVLEEDPSSRRKEVEDMRKLDKFGDALCLRERYFGGNGQGLRVGDNAKMIEKLVADFNLEVVGE